MSQLAHFKEVAGDTGHDTSCLVIVIEAEGLLFQMGEEILAHPGLHLYADHMPVILDKIAQQHAQHI